MVKVITGFIIYGIAVLTPSPDGIYLFFSLLQIIPPLIQLCIISPSIFNYLRRLFLGMRHLWTFSSRKMQLCTETFARTVKRSQSLHDVCGP